MTFEPGPMADKLGNRYEGRWVAKQLLRLLNEELESVTVELIGQEEIGVDILVVKKNGIRQFQQCKARLDDSVTDLKNKGILGNLKYQLSRDSQIEFALVSPTRFQNLADMCLSARTSNGIASGFYESQILKVGNDRRTLFGKFCENIQLDPSKEVDLAQAFNYLQRTYFECFLDDENTWSDILTNAGYLLTGKPETARSVLRTYVEDENKYRQPIYADELWQCLREKHNIYPKQLQHDNRIAPAIENLQSEFVDSIRPILIGNKLISRSETSDVIKHIEGGKDVIIHAPAGYGKSGVLYELTEYLQAQKIPYLPIRLDRRIPDKNAKSFGEDMGLPESPAFCLASLAGNRKSVLILDQLDAIRWTTTHSISAMNVCKEIVRQVRSLHREGKEIVIVFACRTFDKENDPEIKNLLAKSDHQDFFEVPIKEFSDEQLKEILGEDLAHLTNSQKKILAQPQNLSIWMQLKQEGIQADFRSATELMRRFWEKRREDLEQKARFTANEINEFLERLVEYMEKKGEISAPESFIQQNQNLGRAFISYGILQQSQRRISFCHQHYLDYQIAERVLRKIREGDGSVKGWLGEKKNQTLFRREQTRQVFVSLVDESFDDFFANARELLESEDVRFHIKHLVLEVIGQLDSIPEDVGKYCIEKANDVNWENHIFEVVFYGHHHWVSYLLKTGIISKWLISSDERKINVALWFLRSISNHIPDEVTEILSPFVEQDDPWPNRVLNTICWNAVDDSDQMFELRLRLMQMGYAGDFIDWKSLCEKYPLRAIVLIGAVLSSLEKIKEKNKDTPIGRRNKLETLYNEYMICLRNAAQNSPEKTWDLLILSVEQQTINLSKWDRRWRDKLFSSPEIDIHHGIVELLIISGQVLASQHPDELLTHTILLENSTSPIVQEIILAAYAHFPASHANKGIEWLLGDLTRFRLGTGDSEAEWMPAVRLIKALSPYCSIEVFEKLETSIFGYHDLNERKEFGYYRETWRIGLGHYWGDTQYFLLPALDPKRIKPDTADLIQVLRRKFANYPETYFIKNRRSVGGSVGSKLEPNLLKISDRAWLKIISSSKIPEHHGRKWIQTTPDHILEASISQFSGSLSRITRRYPERFARLALQFPENVHPQYISAILTALQSTKPENDVPETEKATWEPAHIETIEAVLDKYQSNDNQQFAMSFCWLIEKRAGENWSEKTIARLISYARNYPDPTGKQLNVYSDKNTDEATVEMLFQATVNCVRGTASDAIGKLLWEHQDWFEQVQDGIESLVYDEHPVIRMAALNAVYPILNIDKDLAVRWFCEACKDDLRIAASPLAQDFFNYIIPSHIDQVGPIISQMVASPSDDIALQGARQVTARWLFYDCFENEFYVCCKGTAIQRKGVAGIIGSFARKEEYSAKCWGVLNQLMNDPDKDVRQELHSIFGDVNVLSKPEMQEFVKAYIKSQAFADNPVDLASKMKEFSGNLIPLAEVIFAACEEFATTLRDKTRDIGSTHHYVVSEIISVLLRLYEQAQGEHNQPIASQCLDIWDLLFENRVGWALELTRAIEQ